MKETLPVHHLREIQDRNLDNPDVMLLLRNTKLLHLIVEETWQVLDMLPEEVRAPSVMKLRALINRQSFVMDQRQRCLSSGRYITMEPIKVMKVERRESSMPPSPWPSLR